MFGKAKENGVWRAKVSNWRVMFWRHDSLYVAMGRWRLRLMKPWTVRVRRSR